MVDGQRFSRKAGQHVPEMTDAIVNSISERYIELTSTSPVKSLLKKIPAILSNV